MFQRLRALFKLSVGVDGDADVLKGVLGAADDFNGHGIEDFIADDDAVEGFGQFGQVYDFLCQLRGGVFGDELTLAFGKLGREFDDVVMLEVV